MSSGNVIGHQTVLDRFQAWLGAGRLASTYLFAGPQGIGKRLVALHLAKGLLCEQTPESQLTPCQVCSACQQVESGTHPDLLQLSKPVDKNFIPVELIIGSREKRMREGLCHDLALKPFRSRPDGSGGRRIAILDDADFLNQEGANSLLKTLEEPPPSAVIFLISSSEHRQLATIRSRSQIVRFQTLTTEQVQQILIEKHLLQDSGSADQLALASDGSLQLALQLSDPDTFEFRRAWFEQLASLDPGQNDFFENINAFVEGAGKDAAARRDRIRLVSQMAARFYRLTMLMLCHQPINSDEVMLRNVSLAADRWPGTADSAAHCIQRCNEVEKQVTANANASLVIESLLSDLGRIVRGEPTLQTI